MFGGTVKPKVSSLLDLAGDLAGTYPRTTSSGAAIDAATVEADLAALLDRVGRNNFEGHTTQRVYSVLNKTRSCDVIADHPRVLALLDRLFLPNYLLSMLQVINILPGEQAQMLHTDDGFYPIPRPRAPLG